MRTFIFNLLITANALTTLPIVGATIIIFLFPTSPVGKELLGVQAFYFIYIVLLVCEFFKWPILRTYRHHPLTDKTRFFLVYGIVILFISLLYLPTFYSMPSLLYIVSYLLIVKGPKTPAVIVEKSRPGQALPSDHMFKPLTSHEQTEVTD